VLIARFHGIGKLDAMSLARQSCERFLGIDIGAETVKVAELIRRDARLEQGRRMVVDHGKEPQAAALQMLAELDWPSVHSAAATGRLSGVLRLHKVPIQAAQAAALAFRMPDHGPLMLVSIGSRGFSVLEIHESGRTVFRENNRCSQGTGNFLRQLAERFGLSVGEASLLTAKVQNPASLSGRCPVILKTDMTHLANKGEKREQILAGLFDAVCENVQTLIKPQLAPKRVLLAGGVSCAPRVRLHFQSFFAKHGLELVDGIGEQGLFLEATGAAFEAARLGFPTPSMEALPATLPRAGFDEMPALRNALPRVRRMNRPACSLGQPARRLVLGIDAGSTGSKLVALDLERKELVWEAYRSTRGDPVNAAKDLVDRFVREGGAVHDVLAFGVTGSGREIVGSLLSTCYGVGCVYILNEIAAHAAGAMHYDPGVDTIFEIGGQDAKYIRLSAGQVCDAAMNEACSAGTGSFIEEQGRRLAGVDDVIRMNDLALGAERCLSLGQHCSVFMAEIIDAAVSAGRPLPEIIAGVYDSVIQNYLNRVKGHRPIGQKIFCQGMPFTSDALAAALAGRTGSEVTVPPGPGTVGALGIALLAARELRWQALQPQALDPFLTARVVGKDLFVCRSTTGCGGAGNKCRIERLTAIVGREQRGFHWGGSCALYDRGVGKKKLPEGAPDPFREREALIAALIEEYGQQRGGRPTVAMTDEFVLKQLFPFFAAFVQQLGFDLIVRTGAGRKALKRGIEESNVPYCAPLQLYTGLIGELLEANPDYVLLPMLRDVPRLADEPVATTCSLAQASADIIRLNLRHHTQAQMLTPVLDAGPTGIDSAIFRKQCRRLAEFLGVRSGQWRRAFRHAYIVQEKFQSQLHAIGANAVAFSAGKNLTPVVVLGRTYTIYNDVLNSNVPALLRELGALPIPVDCYPVGEAVPVFRDVYYSYSQMNLRAAHQIRRTPGVYSVFCSNYSCGPDSFNLHFYSHLMEHKPFALIETDGHSGDAGTKTRLEAFLYCTETDMRAARSSTVGRFNILHSFEHDQTTLADVAKSDRILLIPRMGVGAEVLAAVVRADGIRAEALPVPDREAIATGRRHTSGKECLPLTVTLGSVLKRILAGNPEEKYVLLMPRNSGPCRFGLYHFFDKLIFSRLGLEDRISVFSPPANNFFKGLSHGFALRIWASIVAADILTAMLHEVRPVERLRGTAAGLHEQYIAALMRLSASTPAPSLARGVTLIPGDVFGLRPLLAGAGSDFAAAVDPGKDFPTVALTGEIYVRCDPGSNDYLIERLEERGLRVKLAPVHEFIEYADWCKWRYLCDGRRKFPGGKPGARLSSFLKRAVLKRLSDTACDAMGWPPHAPVARAIACAADYLSPAHHGEAILSIGGPLLLHREEQIAGAVCVGPLECLPNRIAESQLYHASEDTGLVTQALYLNGDPLDAEILDNFVYEVHRRHALRKESTSAR
jgi:predicted CoA-substrate-specific enzyme activase